ncbi:MAG: hypothetical protein A2710_22000 [Burkholderiales bacterium RIFCSPHIGHO2_01_FULL_64_960]|nr:MAG: hypothetical protein A2710_22000 [Burkholderiales bacterium RIFCSPHIGHO2_01_FULL_64_960]
MVDILTAKHWSDLRQSRPVSDDALALASVEVTGVQTGLSIGMDSRGWLHLLVPCEEGAPSQPVPDLNCLRVRQRTLDDGAFIELSAPPSHERVFTPFCRDIISAVCEEGREPWRALPAIVRTWQSAWKPVRPEMDKSTQVGLFGELVVLRYLLIPAMGPGAVESWSGPEYERHDFVLDHLHIEVKTTRKSRPEHEISRLDQLHVPAGKKLLLVSIQLEETAFGRETLATQLDAVIDELRGNAAALDSFMAKMVNVGWSDDIRTAGELMRFELRDSGIYPVDEGFPRLPESFIPPSGVVALRYTIDLANLPSIGMEEAIQRVQTSHVI